MVSINKNSYSTIETISKAGKTWTDTFIHYLVIIDTAATNNNDNGDLIPFKMINRFVIRY